MKHTPAFEDSPVTKNILGFGSKRIGQFISPIVVLKVFSPYSAGFDYPYRLNILHEARSREWKTQSMKLAMQMLDPDMYIYIDGSTTLHGLKEDYGQKYNDSTIVYLNKKGIGINDANLFYDSLARRSRERFFSGMAVALTENKFTYSDNVEHFKILGRISLTINMVTRRFNRHKNEIFDSTLGNRMFIVHGWMKEDENLRCKRRFERTKGLKPPVFIEERYNKTIKNMNEYEKVLVEFAKDYAILSVRNTVECVDIVKALVTTNARINHRNYLAEDDITLLRMLRPYTINPMVPDEPRVIGFLKEGRSYKDICHLLGKKVPTYYSTISYYKKRALERGTLDAE